MSYESLLEEQSITLAKIAELVAHMQDYVVTMANLRELEEHVLTLGQLERDLEIELAKEDDEERYMQEREDNLERLRAIEATQF